MNLKIVKDKLTFSEALVALKERKWIKCPEWSGYWWLEAGKINVMKHDGTVTTTPWLEATVLREDWQIVEEDMSILLEAMKNMNYGYFKDSISTADIKSNVMCHLCNDSLLKNNKTEK